MSRVYASWTGTGCRPTLHRSMARLQNRPIEPDRAPVQSPRQSRGMPADMVFHECRYEVVAVVIAGPAAKIQGDVGLRASLLQELGAKLFGQEWIGIAVVDQE